MSTQPFVDFYRSNKISPVSQDITNIKAHFGRRESLFRLLGIPPRLVHDRDVLELCPGSGHNSVYTQSLGPRSYTLVDANEIGLDKARELFALHHPRATVRFERSFIADYRPRDAFDIVFCEGAIPLQHDPIAFTRDLCRFVAPSGILVVTSADSVSFMGECVRRLLASTVSPPSDPLARRLERLRPMFAAHLASLRGASRPLDDWLLDNIIQPFTGIPFSIADAISALDPKGFEFYGSSPSFNADWRWYKDLTPGRTHWNARATASYFGNVLNLLDCRYLRPQHAEAYGRELLTRCDRFFRTLQSYELGDGTLLPATIDALEQITAWIRDAAPETAQAFAEVSQAVRAGNGDVEMPQFQSFFGRGQQYLSFVGPAE